jgi:hypothetical protein
MGTFNMIEILLPPSSAMVRNMQLTSSSINLNDVVCREGYLLFTLIKNEPGVNYLLHV